MGGKSSKDSSGRAYRTSRSGGSDSWSRYGYPPQSGYPSQTPYYTPQNHCAPPRSSNYGSQTPHRGHKIVKYSRIADNYETLDQVSLLLLQFLWFLLSAFFLFRLIWRKGVVGGNDQMEYLFKMIMMNWWYESRLLGLNCDYQIWVCIWHRYIQFFFEVFLRMWRVFRVSYPDIQPGCTLDIGGGYRHFKKCRVVVA